MGLFKKEDDYISKMKKENSVQKGRNRVEEKIEQNNSNEYEIRHKSLYSAYQNDKNNQEDVEGESISNSNSLEYIKKQMKGSNSLERSANKKALRYIIIFAIYIIFRIFM